MEVPEGGLAFTFAQVPIIYRKDLAKGMLQVLDSRANLLYASSVPKLPLNWSQSLFSREGKIGRIEVGF